MLNSLPFALQSGQLGVVGIDTADEAELMIAMKSALRRAKAEIDAGKRDETECLSPFILSFWVSVAH